MPDHGLVRPVYTGDLVAQLNAIFVTLNLQQAAISDFIAILVEFVSAKRQCRSISQTKAVCLLESETATQSHREFRELHFKPRR